MMEFLDLLRSLTPIFAALVVIVSMRSTQKTILRRMDKLEANIEKAHDRLDRHILDWHK